MNNENYDNYYILEEDDDSPKNFAAYTDAERSVSEEEENSQGSMAPHEKVEKEKSPIILLLHILFNPIEGWKSLRRAKLSIEQIQGRCFYPILAILAVSKFAEFFYSVNVNLQEVITEAIIAFVAYFFGYFCCLKTLCWMLPQQMEQKFNTKFGKDFLIISLSSLALFSIFTEILPMIWPILIFLPIWTLYILFKGVRFFKFAPREEMKFFVLAAACVIGMPILIDWILNTLLPY